MAGKGALLVLPPATCPGMKGSISEEFKRVGTSHESVSRDRLHVLP